ncbi:MAG: NADH-quinone oxidoreductase subunit D, partial [Actinomycetota bacterium]
MSTDNMSAEDVVYESGVGDDAYADSYDTGEGRVFTLSGGDWDTVTPPSEGEKERIVVNMGPQHPSTHGVLRLILELEGETVTETRCGIGYLHTGIEKNMEYRTWTQGVTFVTRMDYLSPFFNETAYCLGVEKLLGVTDEIPDRASTIRVMMMELNRISSHLVALATGGMELGALTAMIFGFRERELILDIFEMVTGLRMNSAYVRPGGVAQDITDDQVARIRETLPLLKKRLKDTSDLLVDNAIWMGRTVGIGYLDLSSCMALGITGPILRSTGLPHDLRKSQPYCGYETYEFEVATQTTCDAYGRFLIRLEEIQQSLKIVEQALDRLAKPGPVMVADKKIAWPAQLSIGSDGQGNSL